MARAYLNADRVIDPKTGALFVRYREIYLKGRMFRPVIEDGAVFIDGIDEPRIEMLRAAEYLREGSSVAESSDEDDESVDDYLTPEDDLSKDDGGGGDDNLTVPETGDLEPPDFGVALKDVLPPLVVRALHGHGFQSFEDLRGMAEEDLTAIKGVGPSSARKILEVLD